MLIGKGLVLPMLLFPLLCAAESANGKARADAHMSIRVLVPPVFKTLEVTPVAGGYRYRAWTNMKMIVINGREYRFDRAGEQTIFVPVPNEITFVHGL